MRKIVPLLIATILMMVSCRSKEWRIASAELSKHHDVISEVRLEPVDTVTYGERLSDSISYCKMRSNWDSTFLSLYTYQYNEPDMREKYRKAFAADKVMRERLYRKQQTMGDMLDKPYTIMYALWYFYRDENGEDILDTFFVEFNDKKEIVRYICDSIEGWVNLKPEYLFQ